MSAAILAAAERLAGAAVSGIPCSPVRHLVDDDDVATAYAVQRHNIDARVAAGATVVGRKIGLTSAAVQAQLGVDQPDFGVLLDDMDVTFEESIPYDRLLQPKAEAELAFVLGGDGTPAYALAALEIVDSRIADWDITFTDTVADNASSGLFVLGTEVLDLRAFDPRAVEMTLWVDGVAVSRGSGAACLGDPLAAVAWLADTAAALGDPLRPGQVVLSGALGPMVDLTPGSEIRVTLTHAGRHLTDLTAHVSQKGQS
jgi:2-keto-4-pentenoate hydratase